MHFDKNTLVFLAHDADLCPRVIEQACPDGLFPRQLVDVGNFPIEALFHIMAVLQIQQLVIDVMIKSASYTDPGTSSTT